MNERPMNCDDYREAIAASPAGDFDGGEAHAAHCADCRALRDEYRDLDRRIARALELSVPELVLPELPDVGEAEVVELRPRSRPRVTQPAWFGIAAGLALAAFVGLQFAGPATDELSLADQVIAHLDHEPASRVVTDIAVPERTLSSVVHRNGVDVGRGIGLITYAKSCVINGNVIPHLVIQGEKGPVTLLLMPEESVERAVPLEGNAINGVILPLGDGSIAIIGERDEALGDISQQVIDSVKWKT